ncbi:chemotaxis protein CheB [Fimbriimonas ginsengisoli]|uniref:protein-glutamate methylesterase n=1 Tax=Fimbriimonas ginsengisoli Gsoil 348 TaxID=661478 RepID=A0A068NJ29_FIMGI|nr:chemotaxis protein CheB [Fimbriimonas ginsengisoli]AIE83588.1 CheB methylesterase [Fimbriimonas ginsengisoli Gsoil 348]
MGKERILAIGTSAGGVEALSRLVAKLPNDLNAAVLIVLHLPENATSVLPEILSRRGNLKAKRGEDGERIRTGQIYVAPPGKHMVVHDGRLHLVVGPRENGNRPAIDPLFRTVARSHGPAAIGLLLTGLLDDGTIGMAAIKRFGGITIAQDPHDAMFGDMPRNAIQTVGVDYVLSLEEIGPKIRELVEQPVPWEKEIDMPDQTELNLSELEDLENTGRPSPFVCPECQGTLFELYEDGISHYCCRVGHSYLQESLAQEQEEVLEAALWTALRAVKEHNALLERMATRAESKGFQISARNFRSKIDEGKSQMELLSRALGLTRGRHAPSEV